jgi:hypothetical protein
MRPADTDLTDFFADGNLPRPQERLHQLAFSTNSQFRKPFEPPPLRHFRLSSQPVSKPAELTRGNLALRHSIEQMVQQRRR